MINKGYVDKTSGYREIGEVVVLTAVPFSGYVFDHWEGDVDPLHIHDNPLTIVMDSNKTVEAEFEVQKFSINIITSGDGTTDPTNPLIVEYGTNQTINFTPGSNNHVNSVVVDSTSVGAPSFYTFAVVKANHTLDVEFAQNSIGLRVSSLWGIAIPTVGFVEYNNNDTVNCSMSTPIVTDISNSKIRYVCTGWIGTGDCPASGSGLGTSFVIHQYSEITWQWKTQYYVSSQSSGHGTVTAIGDWYDSGSVVHMVATPDSLCTFLNWTGDVPDVQRTTEIIDLVINSPKVCIANFQVQSFPPGGIIMWSGTIVNIPTGWALCNGTNGTPNLSGKFIVGYNVGDSDYSTIGNTGGEKTHSLTTAEMPAHNHSADSGSAGNHTHTGATGDGGNHRHTGDVSGGNHSHTYNYPIKEDVEGHSGYWGTVQRGPETHTTGGSGAHSHSFTSDYAGSHSHDFTSMSYAGTHSHTVTIYNNGSNTAHENRPPYYTLAFIMKL